MGASQHTRLSDPNGQPPNLPGMSSDQPGERPQAAGFPNPRRTLFERRIHHPTQLRYRMPIPSGTLSPSLDLAKRQIARAALQSCRPFKQPDRTTLPGQLRGTRSGEARRAVPIRN